MLNRLWAPWRLAYVAAPKPPEEVDPCFLCRGIQDRDDKANLVLQKTELSVVVLNRFPYNNGHLLIAPLAHKATLEELTDAEALDLQKVLKSMKVSLDALLHPDGYNIGLNLGAAAGAGLPGHLHWHIVPRWHGDTNFMPVLTDAKVIVQSLDTLYELLQKTCCEPGA